MVTTGLKKEIYWDLLILMSIGMLGGSTQIFFTISTIYYGWLIIKNKGKIWIPKVSGIRLYIFFILYATIVGLFQFVFRNVIRDLYYVVPSIIWIFIGGHLAYKSENNNKNIFKTLYVYGGAISLKCLITFILNPVLDFGQLRNTFGYGVYEVGFILPIMVLQVLLLKKVCFSKGIDMLLIVVMMLQISLSFGRIAVLEPIIELCVMAFLAIRFLKSNSKVSKRIILISGTIIIVTFTTFYILPSSVTSTFADKFDLIFTEINVSQSITSVSEVMSNWRGYEIQAAQEQWMEVSVLEKIFGEGLGRGVRMDYIPHGWESIIVDGEFPILHNGFVTLQPKGGILAVTAICWIYLGTGIKALKYCRKGNFEAIVLVGISVAGFANAYVVRGPVTSSIFVVWPLLMGWGNCKLLSK